jgi:hypothetical protein
MELTEYIMAQGRPFPSDSRSNDGWFQHVAIILSDMNRAYGWSQQNGVRNASQARSGFPIGIRPQAEYGPSTSAIQTATFWRFSSFRREKEGQVADGR